MIHLVTPVRFEVRCDRGTFSGTLPFDSWDGICALPMTSSDFENNKRNLKGFSESISNFCKVAYPSDEHSPLNRRSTLEISTKKILQTIDVSIIKTVGETVGFSGFYRSSSIQKDLVILVTLSSELESDESVSITVNCEDAVLTTALSSHLKKLLARR